MVPPKDRLRLHQQARPARSRNAFTQRRQKHPISRFPLNPLDLPLEYLDLAPQNQHLGLQLGSVGAAGDQDLQYGA